VKYFYVLNVSNHDYTEKKVYLHDVKFTELGWKIICFRIIAKAYGKFLQSEHYKQLVEFDDKINQRVKDQMIADGTWDEKYDAKVYEFNLSDLEHDSLIDKEFKLDGFHRHIEKYTASVDFSSDVSISQTYEDLSDENQSNDVNLTRELANYIQKE
jgi:hypothetical protein